MSVGQDEGEEVMGGMRGFGCLGRSNRESVCLVFVRPIRRMPRQRVIAGGGPTRPTIGRSGRRLRIMRHRSWKTFGAARSTRENRQSGNYGARTQRKPT